MVLFSKTQGTSQKKRNEFDYLIMLLNTPESKRGFMLIIYGYEPNGSLYHPDREIPDHDFSTERFLTMDQHRYILKRILNDKITKWETNQ